MGCRIKANCRLLGPGPVGRVPCVGVFLRYPSPYLRDFRRKPRKTPHCYVDKRDRRLIVWLIGCRVKANCSLVGLGPVGGVQSVGIFLRDPSLYLLEFRRKPQKTPNRPGFEPGTIHLPVLSAEPLGH